MTEIISISPKDLAEKQGPGLLKLGYNGYIGSITCLEGGRGKLIGNAFCSENLMRNRMLDKSYVVLPLQFHDENGVTVGVSIADSFPANGLPEAIISVKKSMAIRVLRSLPDKNRFSKTLLKETITRLRSELRPIIADEVGLRYCENPDADLAILKKLIPKPTDTHATRYGNNPNPRIEFLDMLDEGGFCNFCYYYGHNEHATTEHFKSILEYIDIRLPDAVNEFAYGYAERKQVDEDLVRQIIKHPDFDMAGALSYLRTQTSINPNKEFMEQLTKWETFL